MTAFASLLLVAALSADGDTVLVQFTSQNCTHCRAMQPVLERMAGEGCPVQVIDVDQQPDYARQFQIRGVPTFVVLTRAQETGRVMGAVSYDKLMQLYRGTALPAAVEQNAPLQVAAPAIAEQTQPTPAVPREFALPRREAAQEPLPLLTADYDPRRNALAASVRLKVEDAKGFGYGTGTIIDVHDSEALVVTCGHLFRESQGKGKISVDLFAPGASQPVDGQLIAYDLERDIALVSIRPNVAVQAVAVAPPATSVRPQDGAFTVGCDKGADATVRESRITAVNKYLGKPNYTAAGAPVDGRSGGGLFTADGQLIGICNAADPADDEGLYAGLASIHWQLDQIGQSAIYQRGTQPAAATMDIASEHPSPWETPVPALAASMPRRDATVAVTPAVYQPEAAPAAVLPAAHENLIAAGDDDTEIVFIVRSKSNPQQRSEVFVVDGATPELVGRISEAARTTGQRRASQAASRAAGAPLQTAHRDRSREVPVVRGQSQDR